MGSCASKEASTTSPGTSSHVNTRKDQQQALNTTTATTSPSKDVPKQLTSNNNSTDSSAESQEKPPQDYSSNPGQREAKVLLLGSGESGKSTIVKQMKILHENGYNHDELYEYRPFVYKNVLDCIKNVIHAIIDLQPDLINKDHGTVVEEEEHSVEDFNGNPHQRTQILDYGDLNDILDYEIAIDSDESFNVDIANKINTVYKYPEVQTFIKTNQGNFYLIDSTHYFLSQITRIAEPNYLPSVADVLRTRKKTSGIFDFKFQMGNGLNIHMFDVGGQRSERRKWIHCFDNVTLIIFCVALSEYDQVLLEENSQNRLEESLTLFDSVVNSRWFARTSVVLFLNKIDVFAEKLPYSPLEKHFPDYTGGNNINKAAKYILWRFTQVNRSGLNIYPHVTQATDTSNIQLVFAAVKETILENSLRDSGLL